MPGEGGYAFVCLLRDRDDAIGLSRLLEDVRLPNAEAPAIFLVPPVAGIDFFAEEVHQQELDSWWRENVPSNDLPVYLVEHEDGLSEWMQGADGLLYVGVPTPAVAALYGSGDRVVTFRSTSPLDFASVVMRDFSRPRSNDPDPARGVAVLFDEGEALRMAALSADFPMNMEDGGFAAGPAAGYGAPGHGYAAPPGYPGQPALAGAGQGHPAPDHPGPGYPAAGHPPPGPDQQQNAFGGQGNPYPQAQPGQFPDRPAPGRFAAAQPYPGQPDPYGQPLVGPATAAYLDQPDPNGQSPPWGQPGAGGSAPYPVASPESRPRRDPTPSASAHPFDLLAGAEAAPVGRGAGEPATWGGPPPPAQRPPEGPPQWGAPPEPRPNWPTDRPPATGPPGFPIERMPSLLPEVNGGGAPWERGSSGLFEDPRLDPAQQGRGPGQHAPPPPEKRRRRGGGSRFQLPITLGWSKKPLKRDFIETPMRDLARIMAERGPTIVVMGSRKGGVGKTSYAAGVAIVAGTVLDTVGHKACIVDANIANPDAWGHLNLREGAATVREVIAALTNNREPPPPVHATTPALACYPESREATEYSKTDVRRFAEYLRRRYTFIVVDMSNRLPDPMAGPEAAAAAYWLEFADALVLPTTSSKLDFVGVLDYLDVRELPPTVVPYIVPSVKKNREHPVTQQYLQVIRERVHRIVEIPDEADSVRFAGMEGVPVEQVSPGLRAAYRELTEVIARVPPRTRR